MVSDIIIIVNTPSGERAFNELQSFFIVLIVFDVLSIFWILRVYVSVSKRTKNRNKLKFVVSVR